MSLDPIQSLLRIDGVRELEADALDAFLEGPQHGTLLFIRGEGARRPETVDVAVALRELKREFGPRLAIGVAAGRAEPDFARRYGSSIVPSVVFLRGRQVQRVLPRVADWRDYHFATTHLLQEALP